jgi:RHH-type proline utilization regulon transcriptional repressor/proline dehydrogenase/delta 1-pyrroline-5-carboxylate dehydrogenase
MAAQIERDTVTLARRIAELGESERSRVFNMSWWSDRVMDWAMARPAFKTQLFRFVDVFPALEEREDIARHLAEYFDGVEVPKALDLGVDLADKVPFGAAIEARVARKNIARMAEQFIVGSTPAEAVAGLHGLWRTGSAATVDLLGEKTVVGSEADRYQARVIELLEALCAAAPSWAPDDLLERDDLGALPRVNVSIKPTALATHYEPLSRREGVESAKDRIRPILRMARDRDAHVHFDMEHYDAKDLTLALFRDLLSEDEFADVAAGIVIQAYLRDSRDDLADLIAWSAGRIRPITVRLVKGAYWDAETVHARASGWTPPVFEDKDETDANYERCARLLHDHHGEVRAAFGSHNLRSLAYAVSYARHRGVPDHGRLASWSPAWRTWCGACSRTPRTRASCGTASPKGEPSTSWSPRPSWTRSPAPRGRRWCRRPTRSTRLRTSPSRCGSGAAALPAPRSAWRWTRLATTPASRSPV